MIKKITIITIATLTLGALVYFGLQEETMGVIDMTATIPTEIDMGEKNIKLKWTDDNTNENLIIKSDEKDYYGFGSNVVTFSVTNASGIDQNITVVISTLGGWKVKWFKEFVRNETITFDEVVVPEVKTATGTIASYTIPSYTKERAIYTDLTLADGKRINPLKKIGTTQPLKQVATHIAKGETKYFQANIGYPTDNHFAGEFFIEAFGDKAYGNLDPNSWTYEQDFNDLNTGDLDGQDSWTANSNIDVQTSTKYEGAKGVEFIQGSAITANRSITAISSGVVYWAFRKTHTNNELVTEFKSGASKIMGVKFDANGAIQISVPQADGYWEDIGTYVVDTWYVIGFEFDDSAQDDKSRAKIDDGAWTVWKTVRSAYSTIDGMVIEAGGIIGSAFGYFDTMCSTDISGGSCGEETATAGWEFYQII